MMTGLELWAQLGYRKNPFKGQVFETGDGLRVRRILTMAVESRDMVCIFGERGIGKTEAIRAALERLGVVLVTVHRGQKEKITIGDIESALVLDLSGSGESPRRSGEARSRQVRRIVGEAARKQKVVLLIEEAHRLHSATLRSLKTLREMEWAGEKELFTVVLVGQSNPMSRPGVSEVKLRTDCVQMHGLSEAEAAGYLTQVLPRHFDPTAAGKTAELKASKNYLELQETAIALINLAMYDEREMVAEKDIKELAGADAKPLPRAEKVRAPEKKVDGKAAVGAVLSRLAANQS